MDTETRKDKDGERKTFTYPHNVVIKRALRINISLKNSQNVQRFVAEQKSFALM